MGRYDQRVPFSLLVLSQENFRSNRVNESEFRVTMCDAMKMLDDGGILTLKLSCIVLHQRGKNSGNHRLCHFNIILRVV